VFEIQLHLYLNRFVARICCKSVRHWLTAAPSNSTEITNGCDVGQLLCFRRTQAILADTVIACITHDVLFLAGWAAVAAVLVFNASRRPERSDVAACVLCSETVDT